MRARDTRFDKLRLLSMYMIVCGHFIYHGIRHITSPQIIDAGFSDTLTGQVNYCLLQLLGYLCNVGPNVFIMITGYFLIRPRTIRYALEKGFRLWRTIVLYSLLIFAIAIVSSFQTFSWNGLLTAITPIYSSTYWFMTIYIGILFLSPFLGKMAMSLTQKEYQVLLIALLIMNFAQEKWGYGQVYSSKLFFYIFVFLIGGYVNLFQPKVKWLKLTGLAYLFICIIQTGANAINQLCLHSTPFLQIRGLTNNSIPLFTSICLFLWFYHRTDNHSPLAKYAVKTSPYILAVYLIHDHRIIRQILWDHIVQPLAFVDKWYMIPYSLGVCALILVVCIGIDKLRTLLHL